MAEHSTRSSQQRQRRSRDERRTAWTQRRSTKQQQPSQDMQALMPVAMGVIEDFVAEIELVSPEELKRAGLEEFLPVYEEACELLEEWHSQHGGTQQSRGDGQGGSSSGSRSESRSSKREDDGGDNGSQRTRGGSREQHAEAGRQSHKND
jgi:uncharacterized protein